MTTNRLQRALERLEAHRIELERQIVAELDELFFSDTPSDTTDPIDTTHPRPLPSLPWRVFGDEPTATQQDTPSTWISHT